jgi:hypothetical protein
VWKIFNRAAFLNHICDLETSTIHSLIVRTFIESNRISHPLFNHNEYFSQVYNDVDDHQARDILNDFTDNEGNLKDEMTLEDVEALFESIIDVNRKKQEGVVYTPDYIVNHLITEAINMTSKSANEICICDPACGSGGFLIGAAEVLRKQGVDPSHSIQHQIVGFDINQNAVEFAKSHVFLYLLKNGESINSINPQIFTLDTLLAKPAILWENVGRKVGFDVVATNPPYVKLQNLPKEYRPKVLEVYGDFATGSYSLAMLFFIACHRMINSDGIVAVITQNNFFTSNAAVKTREYAEQTKCIRRVVDFSNHLIFKGVLAYTCLLFLDKNDHRTHLEYRDLYKGVGPNLLPTSGFTQIPYSELNSKKWRLAEDPHRSNILKIEQTGIILRDLCKISVGFATLRDKIFSAFNKDGKWYVKGIEGEDVLVEDDIIIPAIKIADFDNESDLKKNNRGLIFPYIEKDKKFKIIDENDFKKNAPLAYAHLESFKEELAKRDKGNKTYEAWYAWGRTQGRSAAGPKLLTKTFDASPSFKLDRTDSLFCNGYAVMAPQKFENGGKLSIKGLQKIINSRFMHYYTKVTSFQISGDYQCYQKNFIQLFGIPILSKEECKMVEKGSVAEVEKILSKKYDIPLKHIDEYFDY